MKGNLNDTAFNDILDDSMLSTLWQQFGEGPLLFQHDNAPERGPYRNGLLRLVWKNLTGLHRALTSTPSNTFWDELERRLQARQHRPTSVPDPTNAFVAEWKQVPTAMFQSLPRRVEAVIVAKRGPTSY